MSRDDVIRMAREAGMLPVHFNRTSFDTELSTYTPELERFATLVADAEREACAQVCEAGINNATDWDSSYWDQACANRAQAIRAQKGKQ